MASDRGFTLIEVLVAFVIAALALGALFQGAAGSLAATGTSGRYDEALSRARSHLAAIGHGIPLSPATQQGEEGHDFQWKVVITPIGTASALALYSVQVTEGWQDTAGTRRITLVTRRIGAPP
jgi:general secretion pathway protein I